jgi:hypothetical protein
VLHDGAADAAAAVLGADVDVLEPDAGAALEAGEGGEEDRVADRFAVGGLEQERLGGLLLEQGAAQDSASPATLSASFSYSASSRIRSKRSCASPSAAARIWTSLASAMSLAA